MKYSEYALRIQAVTLKRADRLEELAHLALYIRAVQAYDKDYKYIIKDIKELIDVEKIEQSIFTDIVSKDDLTFYNLRKIGKNKEEYRKMKANKKQRKEVTDNGYAEKS